MASPPVSTRTAPVVRTGGAYTLRKAFRLLDISEALGYAKIRSGEIRTVRPWPGANPKITDQEIARLLGETTAASTPSPAPRGNGAAGSYSGDAWKRPE
jgi:hypothetical protein